MGMRGRMISRKELISRAIIFGVVVSLILCVPVWIIWFFLVINYHLDFNQSYLFINGFENIVLYDSQNSYQRRIWGLKEIESYEYGDNYDSNIISQVEEMVDDENWISQACYSPDKEYILYKEVEAWGPTDDNTYYYKVINVDSKKIRTFYKGPMEDFDIYWGQ